LRGLSDNCIDFIELSWKKEEIEGIGGSFTWVATELKFLTMIRIAGRRLVTVSAGAPAILQTCGNMEEGLKYPKLLYEAMCFTINEMELDTFCLTRT